LAERLERANKPLYRYRPLLSPDDYQQLTIKQAQIDPRTGVTNGAVGHPVGTLEQNAELSIELSAAQAARWVYRTGRWVLERATGSDDASPGKDVATAEGLNAAGAGGGAAKAAEAALLTTDQSEVGQRRKVNVVRELPVPEIMGKVREQPGNTYYGGPKPGPNEEAAGAEFTKLGYDVTHQKTAADRGIKDVQTADLDVAGIGTVDIYTPEKATSVPRILNAIEKKNSQASAVFVQGDFTIDTMQSIAARLWGKPNAQNIKTLFFHSPGAPVRRFNRP
jgi:hypothetical protein